MTRNGNTDCWTFVVRIYWSKDVKFVLLIGLHTWTLVSIANGAELRCRMSTLTGLFQREGVVLNIRASELNLVILRDSS